MKSESSTQGTGMSEDTHAADYLGRHWQTGSTGLQDKVEELLNLAHAAATNARRNRTSLRTIFPRPRPNATAGTPRTSPTTTAELRRRLRRLSRFSGRGRAT